MLVYKFGCLQPTLNEPLVREQLLAAFQYRNLLVWIERGRRAAMRALLDTPEVNEAVTAYKAATKTDRKDAAKRLIAARKAALAAAQDEVAQINDRDASIRRRARTYTTAYWGTYLIIEASADQVRKMPLYERDLVTPADPKYVRWRGMHPTAPGGQIGVQLQGGLTTAGALACIDRRVYLRLSDGDPTKRHGYRDGVIGMRIGSAGRDPIWTEVPITIPPSGMPPAHAVWKWVRLSCRKEGLREYWTCEITAEVPEGEPVRWRKHPRAASASSGALAVELCWYERGDSILVARTLDDHGRRDDILVPARTVAQLRKVASLRSLRDVLRNEMLTRFVDVLRRDRAQNRNAPWPKWLLAALDADAWRSPYRLHKLVRRWRDEQCDHGRSLIVPPNGLHDTWDWHSRGQWTTLPGGGTAYDILQAWEFRDDHLWSYELGARRGALAHRLDTYRVLARRWREQYGLIVVPDRDLSREARFGDDSDRRFMAGPSELRQCIMHVFGDRTIEHPWSDDADDPWLEQAIAAAMRETARGTAIPRDRAATRENAWARRKRAKAERNGKPQALDDAKASADALV